MENQNTALRPYGYYSKALNKVFNSYDELAAAEQENDEAIARKNQLSAERKRRAEEISAAWDKIQEMTKAHDELVDKFIDDYGAFHRTIVKTNFKPRQFNIPNIWDMLSWF